MVNLMYVLIIVSSASNSGSRTYMHDFDDQRACENAAKAVQKMAHDVPGSYDVNTRVWCVPKSLGK